MNRIALVGLSACLAACSTPSAGGTERVGAGGKADNAALVFEDADLQCFDGTTEIGLYSDHVVEAGEAFGAAACQENTNLIKIRTADGTVYEINDGVVVTTDGAGNDTYQALHHEDYGLKIVADLFYDHEVGLLEGHYQLPMRESHTTSSGHTWVELEYGAKVDVDSSIMDCYTYTFE